jgi:hypothetical protein
VSITAVGWAEAVAGLACDHNVSEDKRITETRIRHLRMVAPSMLDQSDKSEL